MSLPVILLAFANDPANPDRYLSQLSAEKEAILAHLRPLEAADLCEVQVFEQTGIEKLFDAIQTFGPRMVLFHFAGHAGSLHLLLESASGTVERAHSVGLAKLLGLQEHLKLVFLNGCSTQKQALQLMEAGVPGIIATSQAINDQVARELSTHFYHSLQTGDTLFTAFQEAIASVQLQHGGETRGLYEPDEEAEQDTERFPWDFYIKAGAEQIQEWNLPEAAGDPLFALPPLPKHYPDQPFRFLEWFQETDARVFYGRSYQIRALFDKIKVKPQQHDLHTQARSANWAIQPRPADPPLVHLYGASGVGKSSILAAGLGPRLKQDHEVLYLRRSQTSGLKGTLQAGLEVAAGERITEAWHATEAKTGKPLIVFLDQGEEVFTRPQAQTTPDQEWRDFLAEVKALFFENGPRPRGKLVLSYRKEYLAEIEHAFRTAAIPWQKVFLQRLQEADIIDAVTGIAEDPENPYHLQIAPPPPGRKALPELVADHFLEDPESPVAPMLQILLSNMWHAAIQLDPAKPLFTHALFDRFSTQGLAMEDFLHQQLKSLENWNATHLRTGWVLDVLAFHTTPLGTATARTRAELEAEYPAQLPDLPALLQELRDRYLLIDLSAKHKTRLAHDTLAPLVRKRYDESNSPGQQSHRVFRNRMVLNQEASRPHPLTENDLALVQKGSSGRRKLSAREEHLYESSLALLQTQATPSLHLTHARKAWALQQDALSRQALLESFYAGPLYEERETPPLFQAVYSPDGQQVILLCQKGPTLLMAGDWHSSLPLPQSESCVQAKWNKDGSRFLLLHKQGNLSVWEQTGQRVGDIPLSPPLPEGKGGKSAFSGKKGSGPRSIRPVLEDFAFAASQEAVYLLHPQAGLQQYGIPSGQLLKTLGLVPDTNRGSVILPRQEAIFSVLQRGHLMLTPFVGEQSYVGEIAGEIQEILVAPDESHLLLWTEAQLYLWEAALLKEGVQAWKTITDLQQVVWSGDQQTVLLYQSQDKIELYDLAGQFKFALSLPDKYSSARFQLNQHASRILGIQNGQTVEWRPARNAYDLRRNFPESIQAVGQAAGVLLVCTDSAAYLLDGPGGKVLQTLRPKSMYLTAAALSPQGTHVVLGGAEGTLMIYSLDDPSSPIQIQGFSLERFMDQLSQIGNEPTKQKEDLLPLLSPDPEQARKAQKTLLQRIREKARGHWGQVHSLCFSPDGSQFLSGGEDWAVKRWDLAGTLLQDSGGKALFGELRSQTADDSAQFNQQIQVQVQQIQALNMAPLFGQESALTPLLPAFRERGSHTQPVRSVAFSPDGKQYLSVGALEDVRRWTVGKEKAEIFPVETEQALFLRSDQWLCASQKQGVIRYQLSEGEAQQVWQQEFTSGSPTIAALSPDSTRFAVGGSEGEISVFSVEGKWLGDFKTDRETVRGLCWADQERLLSGGSARQLRVWNGELAVLLEITNE